MEILRVDTSELHAAASQWRSLASDLAPPTPVSGSELQPSAWAVNEIHAGITYTMSAFAARVQATAIKTSAAAVLYGNQDDEASTAMKAITGAL
jgi:hypothetical protein